MRSIEELLQTKRMFYLPMYNVNSLIGLQEMILEIVKPDFEIAEVGSFAGVSSDLFARYCRKLYCIDLWDVTGGIEEDKMMQAEVMFDEVWKAHRNVIEPIKGASEDVAAQFEDGSLDMVYIDGQHNYKSVRQDILTWLPKIKTGGWITGHDYLLMDVQRAVKDTIGIVKIYKDTSWAQQR